LSDTTSDLHYLLVLNFEGGDENVNVHSWGTYDKIKERVDRHEVWVDTKNKTVIKKFKLLVLSLSLDCEEKIERASMQLNLKDSKIVGHEFVDRSTLDGLKVGY
jgi:hypothetical protein